MNDENKRIAKNTLIMGVRMAIVMLLSLYTTRCVLAVLGVEDFGIYNVVCGFVALFSFLNVSMSNGIQRFYNVEIGRQNDQGVQKVFTTAILMQIVLCVVVLLLAETVGLWYVHNKMVIPEARQAAAYGCYQWAILGFVFLILAAPYSAAVMAYEKMNYYAIVTIWDAVAKLGVVFALRHMGQDRLVMYAAMIALISFLDLVLYSGYCKWKFKDIRWVRTQDAGLFKSLFSFSGWNIVGSLSTVLKEQGINLILNLFFGPVVNAARGIAAQINYGLQGFVSSLTIPVRPQVIQSYAAHHWDRTLELTYFVSKLSCCILLVMAVPLSLELPFVLQIWLGDNVPDYTVSFTLLVLGYTLVCNLNAAISTIVHAVGKMMKYQVVGSAVSIASIPVAYVALRWGADPSMALWIVLLAQIAAHMVCLFIVKELFVFSILDYCKKVILPLAGIMIGSLLLTAPIVWFMGTGWLRFCFVLMVGCVSVMGWTYLLGLTKEERQHVMNLFTRFKNKK